MWRPDLAIGQQQTDAETVDPGIVADGGEILRALLCQRADQVLGHAAQPEAADHDGGSVENVAEWLLRRWQRLCSWQKDCRQRCIEVACNQPQETHYLVLCYPCLCALR